MSKSNGGRCLISTSFPKGFLIILSLSIFSQEEEIIVTPPQPSYQLDEDDDDQKNDLYKLLDDDDGDLEIVYDEDGKPIGRASRANAEQHAELTNLLGGGVGKSNH